MGSPMSFSSRFSGRCRVEHPHSPQVCWVHIGAHKTATKLVQKDLARRSEELSRLSIYYDAKSYWLGSRLKNESPLGVERLAEEKAELRARLESRTESHLILSSEGFLGDPYSGYGNVHAVAGDVARLLEGLEVKIVASLRLQDTFIESLYVQHIKEGSAIGFEEFVEGLGTEAFDWAELLQVYEKLFGAENMRVVWYEWSVEDVPRTVERLFSGLDGEFEYELQPVGFVNPSYNRTGLEIARRCNPLLNDEERVKLRLFLQETFPKPSGESFELFGAKEREKIRARFAASNESCTVRYRAGVGDGSRSTPTSGIYCRAPE
jgi:hypothetical protein